MNRLLEASQIVITYCHCDCDYERLLKCLSQTTLIDFYWPKSKGKGNEWVRQSIMNIKMVS